MVLTDTDINNLIQPFLAFVSNPDFYRLPHNRGEELKDAEIEQLYSFAFTHNLLIPEDDTDLEAVNNTLQDLVQKGEIFRRPVKVYRYRGELENKSRSRYDFSPALSDRTLRKLVNRGTVIEELDSLYIAKELLILTDEEKHDLTVDFAKFIHTKEQIPLNNGIPLFNGVPLGNVQLDQMLEFFLKNGWVEQVAQTDLFCLSESGKKFLVPKLPYVLRGKWVPADPNEVGPEYPLLRLDPEFTDL